MKYLGVTSAAQDIADKEYVDTGLAAKAPLASPALTGTPTAPTAALNTNTTQVATTAFVMSQAQLARDYTEAQFTLSGGGTVTWDTTNGLKWSTRFIAIPVDKTQASTGFIEFPFPAASTVISGVGGAANVTTTANGVLIPVWCALYGVHTIGGSNSAVTYKIIDYNLTAAGNLDPNWILIYSRNGDSGCAKLGTGLTMCSGDTSTNGRITTYVDAIKIPTPATATNDTTVATTAYVKAQGYLTSYTESSTLATVTGRGATTSTAVTFNGGLTASTVSSTGDTTIGGNLKSNSAISLLTSGGAAQKVYTGGILVSNAYSDAANIPTNGIYSKGDIVTPGKATAATVQTGSFTMSYNSATSSLDFRFVG